MALSPPASLPTPVSLARRAEQALERHGDRPVTLFEGRWYGSGELAGMASRLSAGLIGLGVKPGDRVVVCMTNCPEVGVTYTALWRAGAVATPVLFLLTEPELRHVFEDSGAVAVVTTPEWLAKIQAAAPGLPVVVVGDAHAQTISFSDLADGPEGTIVNRAASDLSALLYTGGTTGRSKGVGLTHASLDAAGWSAATMAYVPGETRTFVPLPLAHVYGLMVSVAGFHAYEASDSVLMRWFDPAQALLLLAEHRVHQASMIPSMISMLLAQPIEDHDLSRLKRVASGGSPLAREVATELERRLPGVQVREGYGCTESSGLISTQPPGERRLGSVGLPIPCLSVRIEGDEPGSALPTGEDGEICVRGDTVMQGYWRSPEDTAHAVQDGWLHTGDVGHLDEDGYLYVVDRLKDLIIRNGFNVYPRDVEEVLLEHPDVVAAAVVGRPDPRVGEEVVGFVQVSSEVTEEELIAFCRERISAAKRPREIRVVDTIPLTSVFKTDRKALRAALSAASA